MPVETCVMCDKPMKLVGKEHWECKKCGVETRIDHNLDWRYVDSDVLVVRRVFYGKDDIPKKERDYRVQGFRQAPVGKLKDWKKFANENGFSELRVVEKDGSAESIKIVGGFL